MMGFKEFHAAQKTLAGIELWRMIKKGQVKNSGNKTADEQFLHSLHNLLLEYP